jgi:hypothetical protein
MIDLYVIGVGGSVGSANIEVHDILFVAAENFILNRNKIQL